MQTLEAIHSRRSVRAFSGQAVSELELEQVVRAAAAAASGGNAQQWLFIGIRQGARIAALRSLCPGMVAMPAAVVALCLDTRSQRASPGSKLDLTACYDIGAAMQNMLLAAHELGLGACPVGSFHEKGVRSLLKLPETIQLCLLVTLGTPSFIPPAPPKRPLDEIYLQESYPG